jgi:hypothetical protein
MWGPPPRTPIFGVSTLQKSQDMEELTPYIPLLIPLFLLQLVLTAAALIDIFRHKRTKGPQWVWALVFSIGVFEQQEL